MNLYKLMKNKITSGRNTIGGTKNTSNAPNNTGNGGGILPKRIILVGNGVETKELSNSSSPGDIRVELSSFGEIEACNMRNDIEKLMPKSGIRKNWKVSYYVSSNTVANSMFRILGYGYDTDKTLAMQEDPRLRDQADNEELMDVYDRISAFHNYLQLEMMDNQVEELNLIIVSHPVPINLFLMKEFNWTVAEVSQLSTYGNSDTVITLELGKGGNYSLCMHHSDQQMKDWGFSEEMIRDQHFRVDAVRGDLQTNSSWDIGAENFFSDA